MGTERSQDPKTAPELPEREGQQPRQPQDGQKGSDPTKKMAGDEKPEGQRHTSR